MARGDNPDLIPAETLETRQQGIYHAGRGGTVLVHGQKKVITIGNGLLRSYVKGPSNTEIIPVANIANSRHGLQRSNCLCGWILAVIDCIKDVNRIDICSDILQMLLRRVIENYRSSYFYIRMHRSSSTSVGNTS